MEGDVDHDRQPIGLADFLMLWREPILQAWEEAVRRTDDSRGLSEPAIRDNLPEMLEAMAELVRRPGGDHDLALEDLPDVHASHRLALGIKLEDVVNELAALRSTIIRLYRQHVGGRDGADVLQEWGRFAAALDAVIQRSVTTYTRARERTLVALNRLSEAALDTGDVETFLRRLMGVLRETTDAIDTVTLLLLEDDGRLHVRAAVGLEGEIADGFSIAVGEGFAGHIAATGLPLVLHDASNDPLPRSRHLRETGLRALYGAPMIHEGRVIGVAHIGSKSAYDFAEADKQLFRIMTDRATSILVEAQLREQLQIREARLRRFVDADVVGVFFWRLSGAITYANRAFLDLVGRPLEDLVEGGIGWRELSPPEFAASDAAAVAEITELGSLAPLAKEFFHSDGRRIPVLIAGTTYPDDPQQGIAFVLDITAQKQAEAESARLAEFRERLLGIVGHDLRNPLSVIRLSLGTLLQREDQPIATTRTLQRMSSSVRRMERILGDLSDFTRIRIGEGLRVEPGPVRVAEAAAHAIEEVEAARASADVRLEVQGDDRATCDGQRLVQLLVNLIDNAIKYGDPATPVRVGVDGSDGGVLRIRVHNEGPPIPPEAVGPDLFDPFHRLAGGKDTDPGRSLGLGLHIVDQITRAHGGTVEVSSHEGEGTTFTVTLPRGGPAR